MKNDDLTERVDALIQDVNTLAILVKRLQIQSQDLLLRIRQTDQDELPFATVTPITDAIE